ncbi:MAG: sensor histidine kinase [Bacteroidia bacterium]|jgi:signal transduction histidine kinase
MKVNLSKQRWKLWLAGFAAAIVAASLWYSSVLVREVADEERKKVALWAEAVKNRATLVSYTDSLFEKIRIEESKRRKIWAGSVEIMAKEYDNLETGIQNYVFEILSSNTTIPAIIVNEKGIITSVSQADNMQSYNNLPFSAKIKKEFGKYKPITYRDTLQNPYSIYFQDSQIFTSLKEVLDTTVNRFLKDVINAASVPVIITDSIHKNIIDAGNLDKNINRDTSALLQFAREMEQENTPINIQLPYYGKCIIYYKDSELLTKLKYYPIIQFAVIALFILVAYFLFNFSRRAEQNRVWVGMSKETAHQLGTPLSSLMAWMEMLKYKGVDEETLTEMNKDVKRLEIITERFSKIGSVPELHPANLQEVLQGCLNYMRARTSQKISLNLQTELPDYIEPLALLNIPLFDWVIENLIRNAIDAMEGQPGTLEITTGEKGNQLFVDISDTGKGIAASHLKTVFEPGYTSKKRGWGLGLSLSKRIIENYHKGKIFVKKSELGKGTTFRILLPKPDEISPHAQPVFSPTGQG